MFQESLFPEKIEPNSNHQEQKTEVTEEPMSEEEAKTDMLTQNLTD